MKKNILWYIGLIITVVALTMLWQIYGVKAWVIGLIISIGSMLEVYGDKE